MNKRIRITTRKRVVVYGDDDKVPFWLDHLLGLIVIGLIVLVGGMVALSLSDWGRATLVWLGLVIGLGLVVTVWLAMAPWRSLRAGEPATVWVGETLAAFGWSAMSVLLVAGMPYIFWRGPGRISPAWEYVVPLGALGLTAVAGLGMWMQTRGPLPALDRTPRPARVVINADDAEGGQSLVLRYRGVDGEEYEAELADLIDDTWLDRFAPGSVWQVYAFRDLSLANTVVFLTEEHDEVWRDGYKLDGVRLGGEGGPIAPGPGSPFLREDSRWTFES